MSAPADMARDGQPPVGGCVLCGRSGMPLTRHHLIPRRTHRQTRIRRRFSREERLGRVLPLCRACHKQIHALLPERELAEHYNTRDALLSHPDVAHFVAWIRDKPAGYTPRTHDARRHGR